MKQDEMEALAAEYVLGTLNSEARSLLRDRLAADPDLRRAVQTWEQRLSALSPELAPLEAPVEPPAGLWDRIAPALDQKPSQVPVEEPGAGAFSTVVREGEGRWEEILPGIRKKRLFTDSDEGYVVFLLQLEPGASAPGHSHSMTEECFMLQGDLSIGEMRLTAGDYHVIAGGTEHQALRSEGGGLLYVRGELREAG